MLYQGPVVMVWVPGPPLANQQCHGHPCNLGLASPWQWGGASMIWVSGDSPCHCRDLVWSSLLFLWKLGLGGQELKGVTLVFTSSIEPSAESTWSRFWLTASIL